MVSFEGAEWRGVAFAERLPHGSLLIMAGQTQKNFKHEVPKEPDITQARINH